MGVGSDGVRDRAEQKPLQSAVSMRAEYDQIRTPSFSFVEDHISRGAAPHLSDRFKLGSLTRLYFLRRILDCSLCPRHRYFLHNVIKIVRQYPDIGRGGIRWFHN